MPVKTKEKFDIILRNYKEKCSKYKKQFSELRLTRNKFEKNEKSSQKV